MQGCKREPRFADRCQRPETTRSSLQILAGSARWVLTSCNNPILGLLALQTFSEKTPPKESSEKESVPVNKVAASPGSARKARHIRRNAQIARRGPGIEHDPAIFTFHSYACGAEALEERVKLVNGTLAIESQPKRGTTIYAHVPIRSMSDSAPSAG